MDPLLIASIATFIAVTLAIVGIAGVIRGIFENNERLWLLAQNRTESKLEALKTFAKDVLVQECLKLNSVNKMYKKLKLDAVRANYPETPQELLAQILFEGLLIFLGLSALCITLFGVTSMLFPVFITVGWVLWMRPSLTEADGEKRSRAVYRRLPYALDLGVLVLQSGGTLRDAMEIISDNDDPLAQEFRTAIREIDTGASQAASLLNMCDRVGVSALDTIVMAINRGAETGAPMAQTLSTQADLFRERRLEEIEKMAVEAPTKMTMPNMLVMFSVLLLVLGPVLVKIGQSGII